MQMHKEMLQELWGYMIRTKKDLPEYYWSSKVQKKRSDAQDMRMWILSRQTCG